MSEPRYPNESRKYRDARTSLVDGFDRSWYQVTQDASLVAIAKAPAERINAWAKQRGWSQIALVSGSEYTVWPYWNLMDFTPEGRPDIPTPPQEFRSEFLEKNYLNKK